MELALDQNFLQVLWIFPLNRLSTIAPTHLLLPYEVSITLTNQLIIIPSVLR